jgi:site-specific DNA-methyltransferase (adenine-specific)/modification methylase
MSENNNMLNNTYTQANPYALLIQADCLKAMPLIPDNTVDLIFCDLPYGTTQNNWDSVIPLNALWEHYWRILKPNGVILLMSQGIFTAKLILSQERYFKYKITWVKSKATNFLNAKKQPLRKHEDICVFYKCQPKYYPQMSAGEAYDKGVRKNQLTGSYGDFRPSHIKSDGERYPTDVVYFKTAESEGRVWHSTQKPVALARYFIRTYSNEGDTVLDNAFGSGSIPLSAVLENRNCIGIEKNENILEFKGQRVDLADIAKERIEAHLGKGRCAVERDINRLSLRPFFLYDELKAAG